VLNHDFKFLFLPTWCDAKITVWQRCVGIVCSVLVSCRVGMCLQRKFYFIFSGDTAENLKYWLPNLRIIRLCILCLQYCAVFTFVLDSHQAQHYLAVLVMTVCVILYNKMGDSKSLTSLYACPFIQLFVRV